MGGRKAAAAASNNDPIVIPAPAPVITPAAPKDKKFRGGFYGDAINTYSGDMLSSSSSKRATFLGV